MMAASGGQQRGNWVLPRSGTVDESHQPSFETSRSPVVLETLERRTHECENGRGRS